MIRKVQIEGSFGKKIVEIYYKDGVEQSMESAEAGVENIPFTDHFKKQVPVLLTKGGMNSVYDAFDKANEEDENYRPRVCMFCYQGGKPLLVQRNTGIPQKYWNVEMYRYERECTYTHYMM